MRRIVFPPESAPLWLALSQRLPEPTGCTLPTALLGLKSEAGRRLDLFPLARPPSCRHGLLETPAPHRNNLTLSRPTKDLISQHPRHGSPRPRPLPVDGATPVL